MNWKLMLMFIAPLLSQVAFLLAHKDEDDTGIDDKAAAFLKYAATAINAIIADQPLPTLTPELKKSIT